VYGVGNDIMVGDTYGSHASTSTFEIILSLSRIIRLTYNDNSLERSKQFSVRLSRDLTC
jgi:hypothetical protein